MVEFVSSCLQTESYQMMLDELETSSERMKTSINNLMEQTIDKLMTNAGKKVSYVKLSSAVILFI